MLRALSFGSTILPGPAHHCREGQFTSRRAWVHHWWEHLIVDFRRQASFSCGDLIFSSHTTFILSFVIAYTYYGKVRWKCLLTAMPCTPTMLEWYLSPPRGRSCIPGMHLVHGIRQS
jgi:hypothetical protein